MSTQKAELVSVFQKNTNKLISISASFEKYVEDYNYRLSLVFETYDELLKINHDLVQKIKDKKIPGYESLSEMPEPNFFNSHILNYYYCKNEEALQRILILRDQGLDLLDEISDNGHVDVNGLCASSIKKIKIFDQGIHQVTNMMDDLMDRQSNLRKNYAGQIAKDFDQNENSLRKILYTDLGLKLQKAQDDYLEARAARNRPKTLKNIIFSIFR